MKSTSTTFKLNPTYQIETYLNEARHPAIRIFMPLTMLASFVAMFIVLAGWYWVARAAHITDWKFEQFSLDVLSVVPDDYWKIALSDILPFGGVLMSLWGSLQKSNRLKVRAYSSNADKLIEKVESSPENFIGFDHKDLHHYRVKAKKIRKCLEADWRFEDTAIRVGILLTLSALFIKPFI